MNLLRSGTTSSCWSIGRFVGAAGSWRLQPGHDAADSADGGTAAIVLVSLFPELRPGGPVSRSASAFTDLLILVSWAAVTIGGLGFFAAAPFLDLLLGPQWEAIGQLAGFAWLLGVVPIVGVPLGSIIEARGHFRIAGAAWGLGAASVALGVLFTWKLESPVPAMIGLLGYAVALAAVHLIGALRLGLLEGSRLGRGILSIVAIQLGVTLLFVGRTAVAGSQSSLVSFITVLTVALIELGALWRFRYWTPVGAIGASRGLPGVRLVIADVRQWLLGPTSLAPA